MLVIKLLKSIMQSSCKNSKLDHVGIWDKILSLLIFFSFLCCHDILSALFWRISQSNWVTNTLTQWVAHTPHKVAWFSAFLICSLGGVVSTIQLELSTHAIFSISLQPRNKLIKCSFQISIQNWASGIYAFDIFSFFSD